MKTRTFYIAIFVLLLLGYLCFWFRAKKTDSETQQSPKVTIIRDTIWQTKVDTFTVQTVTYKKVFVHKDKPTVLIKDTIYIKDTTQVIPARIYRDTLHRKDIDIYSYNLVNGFLLDSKVTYKLKVPKEITVTKTITHPKTYRSGLYVFSEIGGNAKKFDNLSLGLQYNRKGNWFISYRFNLNQINQPTHNIGIGFRIFK